MHRHATPCTPCTPKKVGVRVRVSSPARNKHTSPPQRHARKHDSGSCISQRHRKARQAPQILLLHASPYNPTRPLAAIIVARHWTAAGAGSCCISLLPACVRVCAPCPLPPPPPFPLPSPPRIPPPPFEVLYATPISSLLFTIHTYRLEGTHRLLDVSKIALLGAI